MPDSQRRWVLPDPRRFHFIVIHLTMQGENHPNLYPNIDTPTRAKLYTLTNTQTLTGQIIMATQLENLQALIREGFDPSPALLDRTPADFPQFTFPIHVDTLKALPLAHPDGRKQMYVLTETDAIEYAEELVAKAKKTYPIQGRPGKPMPTDQD